MLSSNKQIQDEARTWKPANPPELEMVMQPPPVPPSSPFSPWAQQTQSKEVLQRRQWNSPHAGLSCPLPCRDGILILKWVKQVFLLLWGEKRLCKPKMQTIKLWRGKQEGSPSTGPVKEIRPPYYAKCMEPDTRHLSPLKLTSEWQALGSVFSWLLRQSYFKSSGLPKHVRLGGECDTSIQPIHNRLKPHFATPGKATTVKGLMVQLGRMNRRSLAILLAPVGIEMWRS